MSNTESAARRPNHTVWKRILIGSLEVPGGVAELILKVVGMLAHLHLKLNAEAHKVPGTSSAGDRAYMSSAASCKSRIGRSISKICCKRGPCHLYLLVSKQRRYILTLSKSHQLLPICPGLFKGFPNPCGERRHSSISYRLLRLARR